MERGLCVVRKETCLQSLAVLGGGRQLTVTHPEGNPHCSQTVPLGDHISGPRRQSMEPACLKTQDDKDGDSHLVLLMVRADFLFLTDFISFDSPKTSVAHPSVFSCSLGE